MCAALFLNGDNKADDGNESGVSHDDCLCCLWDKNNWAGKQISNLGPCPLFFLLESLGSRFRI